VRNIHQSEDDDYCSHRMTVVAVVNDM